MKVLFLMFVAFVKGMMKSDSSIVDEALKIKEEIVVLQNSWNNTDDVDLIDSFIYEIISKEKKLRYLRNQCPSPELDSVCKLLYT